MKRSLLVFIYNMYISAFLEEFEDDVDQALLEIRLFDANKKMQRRIAIAVLNIYINGTVQQNFAHLIIISWVIDELQQKKRDYI